MDKKTVQFMDRCKPKCGFSLSAVYSHFVASQIDSDVVNEIIRVNSTDMPCTMIVNIRSFVDFLFNLKASIEKILGDGFIVGVYNSLDLWRNGLFTAMPSNYVNTEILKNFKELINQLQLQ